MALKAPVPTDIFRRRFPRSTDLCELWAESLGDEGKDDDDDDDDEDDDGGEEKGDLLKTGLLLFLLPFLLLILYVTGLLGSLLQQLL